MMYFTTTMTFVFLLVFLLFGLERLRKLKNRPHEEKLVKEAKLNFITSAFAIVFAISISIYFTAFPLDSSKVKSLGNMSGQDLVGVLLLKLSLISLTISSFQMVKNSDFDTAKNRLRRLYKMEVLMLFVILIFSLGILLTISTVMASIPLAITSLVLIRRIRNYFRVMPE